MSEIVTLAVTFGTDGWRGVIAEDFTYANVRVAAAAIANYIHANEDVSRGVCVGWDTRFMSRNFAQAAAEVLTRSGISVLLADRVTPTPALSYAVRQFGAAGGVMITSSHNPAQWNGVKYKASYGGSGSPAIMAAIVGYVGAELRTSEAPAAIEEFDFLPGYVAAISAFADLEKIAESGYKFAIDCMYGAGRHVLAGILAGHGIPFVEIRAEIDPTFRGIHPEPIGTHVQALQRAVVEHKCSAGFVTDGDADRIGAVDEQGNFVDSHKIFSILLLWLVERKEWPGDVARSFNTTGMIDRICALHGRKLHEVGIGFKYICDLMLGGDMLIGGEESGGIGIARHLPERDGLLNALLLAGVMAEERKTLADLVADLQARFGEHHYDRVDLHLTEAQKVGTIAEAPALKQVAGMPVRRVATLDGIKLFVEDVAAPANSADAWLLFRASGTEPLLRVYSEAGSPESVKRLLDAGVAFAKR